MNYSYIQTKLKKWTSTYQKILKYYVRGFQRFHTVRDRVACHPLQFLLWNYASSLARFSGNKPALEQRKSLFWSEKWEVGNAKWEIGEVGRRKLEAPLPLSYSLPISLTCSKALVSEPAISIVAVYTWAAELPPKWVKHKNNRSNI